MIDWQRVCFDLRRVFWSMSQVGRVLEYKNPEYLTKLERGEVSDPRFSLGYNLIHIYKEHVGTHVPMVSD